MPRNFCIGLPLALYRNFDRVTVGSLVVKDVNNSINVISRLLAVCGVSTSPIITLNFDSI